MISSREKNNIDLEEQDSRVGIDRNKEISLRNKEVWVLPHGLSDGKWNIYKRDVEIRTRAQLKIKVKQRYRWYQNRD